MGIGENEIGEIARRHGFDEGAERAMADALRSSGGSMAQFSHPALGGMGQWSRGGMLMIGEMNNHALKARVDALANELSGAMASSGREEAVPASATRSPSPWARGSDDDGARTPAARGGDWWPGDLGRPGATGSQNGVRYAVFPDTRRLAIERDGRVEVRDTGDHRIGGVSQQQGGTTALRFTSQHGDVDLESLRRV